MAICSSIERAGRWFLASGIQEPAGGVARYYRTDLRRNHPVSNEITGYAAGTLTYLHGLTGEAAYLDRALEAARFLTRTAWSAEHQTFPFEPADNGSAAEPLAYFFDCGIIARGLLAVWRATQDREFLDAAVACGWSMARDFSNGADFHPILRLPSKVPLPRSEQWSRSAGCYQLKSALAWFELFEATGETAFADYYFKLLEHSLAECGRFLPGHADRHKVMDRLHAYCYFLEGLLPMAADQRCAAALGDGIRRVSRYRREIAPEFERSDVIAQLLRVRLYADWAGVAPVDREAACEESAQLAQFQRRDADPRFDGGFCFGRKGTEMLPYINPVSAGFALQALALWESYLAGDAPAPPHLLI